MVVHRGVLRLSQGPAGQPGRWPHHALPLSQRLIEERAKEEPLKTFKKALDNVKPILEVKSRRVGGATYQVPVEVRQDRRVALGMRWLIQYAKARGEKTMQEKLAGG